MVNFKGTAKCGVSFFSWNIEGNTLMKKYRITIRSQDLNRYICQRQPLNLPEFLRSDIGTAIDEVSSRINNIIKTEGLTFVNN